MVAITKLLLASETFKETAAANLNSIWRNKDFTDVTLVSAEGLKTEAHKTVLCSFSPFFREVLIENKHTSVLLYMRGVSHKELELLVEFIYTGVCQVDVVDLESFLKIGKELGIEGLQENNTEEKTAELTPFLRADIPNDTNDTALETSFSKTEKEIAARGVENTATQNHDSRLVPPIENEKFGFSSNFAEIDSAGKPEDYFGIPFLKHDERPNCSEDTDLESSLSKTEKETAARAVQENTTESNNFGTFPSIGNEKFNNFAQTSYAGNPEDCFSDNNDTLQESLEQFDKSIKSKEDFEVSSAGSQIRLGKEDVKKKYECPHCEKSFNSQRDRRRHIDCRHLKTKDKSCDMCDYKTVRGTNLLYHIQSVHEGIRYSCDECSFQATTQGNVNVHKKIKHQGLRYRCDQCDHSVTSYNNLLKHKKSKHEGVQYSCKICDYKVKTEETLLNHMRNIHEAKLLSCDFCDYTNVKMTKLEHHTRSVHQANWPKCDICDYKTTNVAKLEEHFKISHSS